MINKIIFLDFDGVLTTCKSLFRLDPEKLGLLGKIIDATDCRLVISSAWRSNTVKRTIKELSNKKLHRNNGLVFPYCDRIIGVTDKNFYTALRGEEIAQWIKDNHFTGKYVILDDMNEMLDEQQPYFVLTDMSEGLTELDVEKAIKLLK